LFLNHAGKISDRDVIDVNRVNSLGDELLVSMLWRDLAPERCKISPNSCGSTSIVSGLRQGLDRDPLLERSGSKLAAKTFSHL